MNRHRYLVETEARLPQPPAPAPTAQTFLLCSPALLPGLGAEHLLVMQWLYQQAFQEAQAVVKPSVLERDLSMLN